MVLQLHISATQQKAASHNMRQNGSDSSQRVSNVNPSPRISRLADKLQSKVCSFPAKELQVLGTDGPFHRERTEPLGTTEVPLRGQDFHLCCVTQSIKASKHFDVLNHSDAASLIS